MRLYSRLKTFIRNLFANNGNDLSVEVYCYPPPIENRPLTLEEYLCQVEQFGVFREEIAIPYLALGLCSEIGEARGSYNEDSLKKELGDVCWYTAMLSIWAKVEIATPDSYRLSHYNEDDAWYILVKYGCLVGDVKKILRGDKTLEEFRPVLDLALNNVLLAVAILAKEYGFTLEDILGTNVYKLTLRQQNGTIKGSGDDR